ncbi:MAG TPA: ABC-F type ribosomal protection protein [Bacillales bacterium]|nr:ABC-F type ribosomal protection protein [Bacillales bacterium]
MLLFEGISLKHYVQERLLFDIELLQIHDKQRIGLVGRNGSGKTTLLNIIQGEIYLDEGKVNLFTSIKLVPQFKNINICKSGGEITQSYLQSAFNESPGLLLLDEPTTHLDYEHIVWLENNLHDFPGALLIVSHDRAFLDQVCTEIWEIEDATITVYKGNYSEYANQKTLERKQHQVAFEKYEKEKQKIEEAIRKKEEKAQRATKKPKNLSASDARQKGAKPYYANKQKKLSKTVSAFETKLEQLKEVKKPRELPPIKMNVINEHAINNKIIIRGEEVFGKMGKNLLWNPFNFYVRSGEKIAVIGSNGTGKTTLLKKIIDEGQGITISPAVKIGYFSQHITILKEQKSILENIQLSSKQNETMIRTVLARMHFWEDDVYKKVAVLSGGEKVKVALAKLFLSEVNLLVLDEPTNFLDIESLEALETLIKSYNGTIIFVTHDRMFIKNVATKVLEIENREVTVFDGTYEAYEERVKPEKKDINEDKLLLIEIKISDVLARLSLEPSKELDAEFQRLLNEKRKLIDHQS